MRVMKDAVRVWYHIKAFLFRRFRKIAKSDY